MRPGPTLCPYRACRVARPGGRKTPVAPNHQHHHADHADHADHSEDFDWEALGDHLEREAELHLPYLESAADWLRDLRAAVPGGGVRRVLDVGSGPGVATCVLAHRFPDAETVAVDQASGLLDRARARAAAQGLAGRVHVQQAELPDDFPALGEADVIWTSNVIHHLGDQQAALGALAARLRPGGVLCVAERGLPLRYLPRDAGIGRPGLQARLDAAQEDWFAGMRAELPDSAGAVEDWPTMLREAGLTPAGTRSFLTDHPAPLGPQAREHLQANLTRMRDHLGDRIDAEDRATLERLTDPESGDGVLRRPDAFLLTATTLHTATRR